MRRREPLSEAELVPVLVEVEVTRDVGVLWAWLAQRCGTMTPVTIAETGMGYVAEWDEADEVNDGG